MPNQPMFSILHTSIRPDKWYEIYNAWLSNAHNPANVEYVLVCDHDWGFDSLPIQVPNDSGLIPLRQGEYIRPQDKAIWARGPRHCYVDGVNRAAINSTGKILVVNADDQYPCKNWDKELLDTLNYYEKSVEDDFVIWPSTGTKDEHIRKIAVMPILSRTRYNKLGFVFHPLYESMFADNDFLAHAQQDNVVIEAKHLLFPHRHPFNDDIPVDQWSDEYKAQNRPLAFQIGQAVFEARRNTKFNDQPAQERAPIHRKTIVVCLPGESFCMEWVTQWTETLCQLSTIYNVLPIFSYTTNVFTTRESLYMAAVQMKPDYIVWIDDDNIVAPGQIQKLLLALDEYQDIDVISGWCWLRSNAYDVEDRVSCGYWDGVKARTHKYVEIFETAPSHYENGDLFQVGWTGFPVVAMRGSIADKLPRHPFMPILSDEYPYGHSGEDVAFCRPEHHLTIFVDRTVKVPHLKRKPDEPATVVPKVPIEGASELAPA